MPVDSPFDIMAETYDADFTHTSIGQLQRKQVWEFLLPVLNSYQRPIKILEINCGTGEDALELSRLGHSVTATDGSELMVEKAKQKAALSGERNTRIEVCKFDELNTHFNKETFDLVFSNFGGLNCIDKNEIEVLSRELSEMLVENGKLFFVIMGRSCLWEILYFSIKGNFGTAFRRKKRFVPFKAGEVEIPVFYYSPAGLKRLFNPLYTYSRSHPVGLFIPPSYLEKNFMKRTTWLSRLTRLEKKFNKYSMLSNLADHFCIIFQKKGSL